MVERYDAVVIGGGQAGPFLAARLAGAGRRTALIERKYMGGTCVNDGCTPTKTLVASARVAHQARRGAGYGIAAGPVTADMKAIRARKDRVVLTSRNNLDSWMESTENLTVLRGTGSFVDAHAIEVGGRRFEADMVFLNTGCRAVVPDWPGLAATPFLTNTTILELDELPSRLVIAGGSYVGLEFAQIFRRFGSEVTVVERGPRVAGREDPEVSDAIRGILEAEGIEILTGAADFAAAATAGGIALSVTLDGQPRAIEGSHLLVAVGRQPNVADLHLDRAGVELDARGYIAVDERLRTSRRHIFALGDVNGRGAFTHTSYNDFEIVAANLLDGADRKVTDRVPAYALYIDPPLGRAGMSEAEARRTGRRLLKAVRPMSRVSRAFERDETQGFMSVIADADNHEILGAAILGIEGDEVIHLFVDAMAGGVPFDRIRRTMHIHPTVSELIPTLVGEFKPLD
jgi:pyruvate/2-oxoglutarate dehydrogenase complex dihydrolipoamide dehydrogenase (E3) component